MKTDVTCKNCGKIFEKENKEINRCRKRGMHDFCNRSCVTKYRNKKMTKEDWKQRYINQKKTFDIKSRSGNRRDALSPFRYFLSAGHSSIMKHNHEIAINEWYLKQIWEQQNGICPYTNIKMILPSTTKEAQRIKSLKRASLDRIDSTKGYVPGNVEFVCYAINNAKNNFKKEEMKSFIKEIISSSQNTISVTQEQPS